MISMKKWIYSQSVRFIIRCLTLSRPYGVAHQAHCHGILQAGLLEWVIISFPRDLPYPKMGTHVSYIAGKFNIYSKACGNGIKERNIIARESKKALGKLVSVFTKETVKQVRMQLGVTSELGPVRSHSSMT